MGRDVFLAGSVQIHKKVLAEVILERLTKIDGVVLQRKNIFTAILNLFGFKDISCVRIAVDQNQEISVEIRIYIQYGFNIPGMATGVQSAVREVIENTVDIKCDKIIVNIQGIEGEKG